MGMNEEYLKHTSLEVSIDIRKFVRDYVFDESEYLFYKGKGKEQKAFCSKCYKEYDSYVMELKHNAKGICPQCGAKTQAKNINYGMKNLRNEAYFYFFEKSILDPGAVICKGYYVNKRYDISYKEPLEEYGLQAIYIFKEEESIMLKNEWNEGWVKRSSIFNFNTGYMGNYKDCYYSKENIEEAIKGTKYKYMPRELIDLGYSAIKIFDEYSKYKWIEQLCKLGMIGLVRTKLDKNEMYRCLNYRGDSIYKILRISKGDLRLIRKSGVNISAMYLKIYQMQLKENANLTPEEVKRIEYSCLGSFYRLENILKYMSIKKLSKYLEKQEKVRTIDLFIYDDYLKNCKSLGLNIEEENILFPHKLHDVHQNLIKQIRLSKNKELDKEIKARLSKLNKKYIFESKGLLIKPAQSTEELIEEGGALGHCVATNYTNSYAKGETVILFIRKVNDLNKSFYTVEIKDGEVKQVRGKKNRKPTKDVEDFITTYTKKLKGKTNKRIKKVA